MTAFSQDAHGYLLAHAVDHDLAAELGVGELDGALTYPYRGADGEYRRRRPLDGGKTFQPPGRPLELWWPDGRPEPGGHVLLCEGEPDALAALTAIRSMNGAIPIAPPVVAALPGCGTPVARVVEELRGAGSVTVCLDGDDAGRRAAERIVGGLIEAGVATSRIDPSDGQDLADVLCASEDGGATLAQLLADAEATGAVSEGFAPPNGALRPAREGADNPAGEPGTPKPLGEAAFHGPAGQFVKHVEPSTEADPAAVLIQTLVMFGNALGRQAGFTVGSDEHWCNEYAVIVGMTSSGRKGTSAGPPRHAIGKADPEWRDRIANGGLVSGEGLIYHVRDEHCSKRKPKKGEMADADGYVTELADEGVADKRLMVMESEFSSVLRVFKRESNTLVGVYRVAWEGSSPLRVLAKNTPNTATGAHVSIVGHITLHELRALLTEVETFSGFANRHLWVCSERSKLLPDGPPIVGVNDYVKAFTAALDRDGLPTVVERDEEARRLWCSVYPSLTAGHDGLFGAATSRAEAHVGRLAVIYAALDRDTHVRVAHLRAALEVWRYCEESAAHIFGGRLADRVAGRLLEALMANGPMTKRDLRDVVGHRVSAERMDVALGYLATRGLAYGREEKSGGRPREVWEPRARGANPENVAQSPADGENGSDPAASGRMDLDGFEAVEETRSRWHRGDNA